MTSKVQQSEQSFETSGPALCRLASGAQGPVHAAPHAQSRLRQLQRSIGNQRVSRMLQKKLVVGPAGDEYEREADRVAEAVTSETSRPASPHSFLRDPQQAVPLQRNCSCGGTCSSCQEEEEEKLQRKAEASVVSSEAVGDAPPIVGEVLRSSGQPLDPAARAYFEPRFGYDFSGVRVHADNQAADSARSVSALAYTVGHDLVFGSGQYAPSSRTGQRLLAHELSHVVQQSHAPEEGSLIQRKEWPVCKGVQAPAGREATVLCFSGLSGEVVAETKRLLNIYHQKDPRWKPLDSKEKFDEDTRKAVSAFQRQVGPKLVDRQDGALTRKTIDALDEATAVAPAAQAQTAVPPSQPDTTPPPASAVQPAPPAADVAPAPPVGAPPATASLASYSIGGLGLLDPDLAIDLAIKGVDALPGKEVLGGLWEVFVKPGLLGFLGKLKSTPREVKTRVIDKIANIFSGKDKAFTWAFLKGLLKGFFIDGALGIFIAIWDLVKGLGQLWDFLKDLGKSIGGLPDTLRSLLDGFEGRARQLADGMGPAIDELKATLLGPGQSNALADQIVEKGKAFAKQGGEAMADKLLSFFSSPEATTEIGDTVGDLLGMALWEVVFAALTAGAGTAVSAIKEGTGAIAKFLSKIIEGVLKVIEEIKVFFGKVVDVVKEAIAFIKGKLKELGSSFMELLEDAGQFFGKLLGACVEHSPVKCDFKAAEKGVEAGRKLEQGYVNALKNRYPKLKDVDIRPKARPSASRFGGAPESAFEERMQTTQGKYSLAVYDRGVAVIELDGISVDGWVEEIKIEQKLANVDDIMAQLRRQADFAEAYGLKGVRYSIASPEVAREVESRVATELLKRNVYRVP